MNENTTTRVQARAKIRGNVAKLLLPDGREEEISFSFGEDVRAQLVMRAIAAARLLEEPIELVTEGELGEVRLAIHPDGRVLPAAAPNAWELLSEDEMDVDEDDLVTEEMLDELLPASELVTESRVRARTTSVTSDEIDEPQQLVEEDAPAGIPAPPAAEDDVPMLRRTRRTFIDTREPMSTVPQSGWRKALHSMGIKISPSAEEKDREQARRAVSAQWGAPRRIAVVNGKGGIGKTMTTAMLSAVFAREGGGGVLAWDNNPTRGSLGWRTESAGHEATVQDVLEHADRLLDPSAPRALMADFVHHQTDDRFDVLRSNPEMLAIRQQIENDEFDLLRQVVDRHYRLVLFDSGNDESAARWLRMVDWTDQLVVPTTPSPEAAESAMLLLDELSDRDEHSKKLASRAVIVLTMNERSPDPTDIKAITSGFEEAGLTVRTVPFDKELKSGPLRFGKLAAATRDAWLQVAAKATEHF
ncbi:MinD/ParA family ATP-binding protein [Microbacterium amylolyticum]|uniref:MinD-like ATPase involved in chromosome partitioning or flagellar assembly n=1 Tax=Microbacterium amylolyticum TaxID=936337 RepID=A0ABS4ZKT6_9MICO|nr:AAA family ATPase [Microbacterium amylolyticum]MBP2437906.1 MinD-like ATPase involved in chromosome partitioning or flagellar assembly [Microbacterium amylolyticum]